MTSKAYFISKDQINQTLRIQPKQGKRLLEPFKSFAEANNLPFKILEDQDVNNEPEVHNNEGDLWLCLEGKVTFICGKTITKKYELSPGDWLWIPPGVLHQHRTSTISRLIIIKIPIMTD